ncbi:MAG: YggS family pyridoxal phosphate-dependent enzyme [Acidimicrobiia bacterium]|nr:YggS family pyridoxal phosphate-dependent enzyme [bacterium]MXZ06357.1 YggS family pyridoxal phosphate-dependent enzyme [Acidimicrobiia bacterium]MCY3652631.1 YggS family pyridoxal phosphate-dependent enzyme [bacterium]MDE0643014.1 YggS family pyridoxal phosphate-dependent enzyme [bacterium]MYD04583.1 YggS family pyridoxal phosphate-dependent enzyme [Acidimicrobiia bacterium]
MDTVTLVSRLQEVVRRVEEAARRSNRSPDEITIVAIGKSQPLSALEEAIAAGQKVFGENRGQELAFKADRLPDNVEWHFVGPLQTNKVRLVKPRVSLIQSFDRDRLLKPWLAGPDRPPPTLLQVNIGEEPQKHGVKPDLVVETFERWEMAGLPIEGVMAIPPFGNLPEESRPYFARMRAIRDGLEGRLNRSLSLSMGMTDDFEVAVEEGSTMVRIGRAIFGPRTTAVKK